MRIALTIFALAALSPAIAAAQDAGTPDPQAAASDEAPPVEAPPIEASPTEAAPLEGASPEPAASDEPTPELEEEEERESEEPEERRFPEPAPVAGEPPEPSYVQGAGRGFFYGVHIHSPSHLTTVQRVGPSFEALSVGPGVGLIARAGWEFGEGFQLELFGGISVNGVDTLGKPIRNTFQRADLGLRTRYTIWTGTVVNPFVQAGTSVRVYWFEWTGSETPVEAGLVPVVHAALGLTFDLTPYFAIDVGASAAYGFGGDIFNEGILFLSPFAGVTLYLYDATGVI